MSNKKKVEKEDKTMTFFIGVAYAVTTLRYIIFCKICFVISNILTKTYSANIKYIIFRH